MDSIAATITHYFLYFFHLIGMESFIGLFGSSAYYCAIGQDKFSDIKTIIMCYDLVWIGYLLIFIVVTLAVLEYKKFNS